LSVTPELMPKLSHAISPELTPESAPTLPLDDNKEPVKLYDAKIATSPNCVGLFGAQAGPSSLLSSLLLHHASRFATCIASRLLPSPSAEAHIGLSDDEGEHTIVFRKKEHMATKMLHPMTELFPHDEEHKIVFEMEMIAPVCLFPLVPPTASLSLLMPS